MRDVNGYRHVHRIAVVGSGPRGLAVLERIAARLQNSARHSGIDIHLIDSTEVGCGRIWRTDQDDLYRMNTVADEVTMFSGPSDEGPVRPGAGPSLAEWWRARDPRVGSNEYAPRRIYGRYLRFVLGAIKKTLPPGVSFEGIQGRVIDLVRESEVFHVRLESGRTIRADSVVLATGHGVPHLKGAELAFEEFAARRDGIQYVRSDSPAEMDLDAIPAGAPTGVIGLGLSAYDVIFSLTEGRQGKFLEVAENEYSYQPSGHEPLIVAGSRSGLPLPGRGRNQKAPDYSYRPVLFKAEEILGSSDGRPLDFRSQVVPSVLAEMHLVYFSTLVRGRAGAAGASAQSAFVDAVKERGARDARAIGEIAEAFGVHAEPVDFFALARPFDGLSYASREDFTGHVTAVLREDLRHAEAGNLLDPLKAALDVLRDTRSEMRKLVDFSGLTAQSHMKDFLGWFGPRSSLLSSGPPRKRVHQFLALLEAGIVRIAGPDTRFGVCESTGRFTVGSPAVAGSETKLDALVDARVPGTDLSSDSSRLMGNLRERGVLTEYVNSNGDDAFRTGGVATTGSPFHPVARDGSSPEGLHVLGIPTENTRWFTFVGSGRPGPWAEFFNDADAIAGHILSRAG
ncbi:FAD/NAD(P)-binding protein [Streptomyces atriruber]|uniref:FAD/NAD(P)-binding protein n=1 Tax=Streptomyces atriruber TaxID=545121 RepID=UPI0006E30369|nr:FAD/NAD(P)-binding protein [Streptomyces atriruber]